MDEDCCAGEEEKELVVVLPHESRRTDLELLALLLKAPTTFGIPAELLRDSCDYHPHQAVNALRLMPKTVVDVAFLQHTIYFGCWPSVQDFQLDHSEIAAGSHTTQWLSTIERTLERYPTLLEEAEESAPVMHSAKRARIVDPEDQLRELVHHIRGEQAESEFYSAEAAMPKCTLLGEALTSPSWESNEIEVFLSTQLASLSHLHIQTAGDEITAFPSAREATPLGVPSDVLLEAIELHGVNESESEGAEVWNAIAAHCNCSVSDAVVAYHQLLQHSDLADKIAAQSWYTSQLTREKKRTPVVEEVTTAPLPPLDKDTAAQFRLMEYLGRLNAWLDRAVLSAELALRVTSAEFRVGPS